MLIAAGVVRAFALFLALDFATSVYADGAVILSIVIAAIAGLVLPFLFGALSYKKSEDPLRELINIIEPKTGVIKQVPEDLEETPALIIYTDSKWFDRPILSLPPDVVQFFAQFDTEIILDINY